MATILTYAAGRERAGADGMTERERQAGSIMRLAQKFGAEMHAADLAGIAESQKAAAADIIQGTIDPDRKKNDAAYAGTVLRNGLHTTGNQLHAALDDPASEHSNMKPDKYKEFLQNEAKSFYASLKDDPHADTQAEIFAIYTEKNQPGLIAKQAKMYKDNMKVKQNQAAIAALADLPQGEGDAFSLNTAQLVSDMLPSDRFTTEEKLSAIAAAAVGAAKNGDRRLLDWAKNNTDAELLVPAQMQLAENSYTAKTRAVEAENWASAEAEREQLAINGEYTKEMWEKDATDPETRERFTITQINRWGKKAHENHIKQLNYTGAMGAFKSGTAMTGYDDKTVQQVYKDHATELLAEAGSDPKKKAEAFTKQAFFLSKQGVPDKELKKNIQAYLNRPVYTKEAFNDPNFLDAAVIWESLNKVMSPEQMVAQVGDQAMSNGALVTQFINDAGGDMEKAGDAYIMHMNTLKNQPELNLPKPDRRDTAAALQRVIDGDLPGRDPAMYRMLWKTKGAESIHTGQLTYELEKQFGIEKQRGLSDEAAWTMAETKVASKAKYFGNELVWTEEADMNGILNMPHGSTAKDRDLAWEGFCETLGIDPTKSHFAMFGQYGYITDAEGMPIEEMGLFPLQMMGNMYEQSQRDKLEGQAARDLNDKLNDIAGHNRMFETSLNAKSGFDDSFKILQDGTTLGDYKRSDEESRMMIRDLYNQENRGFLGNLMKKGVQFIQDVQAGKFKGQANERFRTVATDATIEYLDRPTDAQVDNMREVDIRMEESKRFNDRLLRSRDGEVKLTEEERSALTEETLPAALQEEDITRNEAKNDADYNVREYAIKPTPENNKKMMEAFQKAGGMKGLSEAEKVTVKHENTYTQPYEDSKGKVTIGIGHNLDDNPLDAEEIRKFGKNRNWAEKPMTKDEMIWLFKRDMKDAKVDAKKNWPQLSKLSKKRQDVLTDMMFNMGADSFSAKNWPAFNQNLTAFVEGRGSLEDVIKEMKNSDWHNKDVPERAKADIAIFRKG